MRPTLRAMSLGEILDAAIQMIRTNQPVASIAVTLAYYDLCVRKEGLDIEQMMARAGMASAQGAMARGAQATEGILGLSAQGSAVIEGHPQTGSGDGA